jgi:hypothetical protein
MSCSRPRYGGYSALRGFFVRRFVQILFICNVCSQLFLNSHRTNSLPTLFHELFRPSNSPSTPRSNAWPSSQVDRLRWRLLVLYQTFKKLFVAKSLHKTISLFIFSSSPILYNFYYAFFYDVHKIVFFLVELHLLVYGLPHADLYAQRGVVGFILYVVFLIHCNFLCCKRALVVIVTQLVRDVS